MKNYFIGHLLLALLVAFTGCKVSQDVLVPELNLPTTYRSATMQDTASVARLPWNKFFTETDLQSLIDSAVARNNDLQLAVKNLESAQLVLRQARLGYLPDIQLRGTATSTRPSDNSLNGVTLEQFLGTRHIEDFTAAAAISWEADIWGKIRSQKAAALAVYLQTEEARKAVQTQLVTNVAQSYYNLLMLDEQLRIAHKNLKLSDSTIRVLQLQFNAGQVTSLALQQVEAQRLTAARLIPQFEQAIIIQENALSILVGKLPAQISRSATLETVPTSRGFAAGLPSQLLHLRPDVRRSELAVIRANADVGLAKANLYPSLVITAQGGINAIKASNWFNIPASLFGTVAGGLTQPLFEKRRLRTQYYLARLEREKSIIEFRQQVLIAVGEVSDALVRMDKLQQQQTIAANRAKTLQQATGNAAMLFKSGMANYLEVLSAQTNVLQSELELTTIKKAQLDATIDLYRSVGGGWK